LDGIYGPFCAEVFLKVAEGVGVPVVERLLATFLQDHVRKVDFVTQSPIVTSTLFALSYVRNNLSFF
jgi:S-ribosylhomocysteine lyase LuxS involved in autoinducer biosynthesis